MCYHKSTPRISVDSYHWKWLMAGRRLGHQQMSQYIQAMSKMSSWYIMSTLPNAYWTLSAFCHPLLLTLGNFCYPGESLHGLRFIVFFCISYIYSLKYHTGIQSTLATPIPSLLFPPRHPPNTSPSTFLPSPFPFLFLFVIHWVPLVLPVGILTGLVNLILWRWP